MFLLKFCTKAVQIVAKSMSDGFLWHTDGGRRWLFFDNLIDFSLFSSWWAFSLFSSWRAFVPPWVVGVLLFGVR